MAEHDYKNAILRFVQDSSREEDLSIARFIASIRTRRPLTIGKSDGELREEREVDSKRVGETA
jgi:hypothetical protein